MIPENKPYVLILGGTNFVGKTLLDELQGKQYNVCCINRGKIYWNNEARTQHPEVQWFCSDRKDHTDYCSTIRFAGKHLGISPLNKWAAVIDFCGYKWRDVQSVLHAIQNLSQKYIFISSDSVYNNSVESAKSIIEQHTFNLQTEYKRIQNAGKKDIDNYGYNKMKCELYLQRKNTIPYVCLRLPDVIGPYDNTDRFWTTLKWMQNSQIYPMPLSANDQNKTISLVDSISVSKFLLKLIQIKEIPSNTYNICLLETFTLFDFLETIRKYLGIQVKYTATKEKSSDLLYPSVQCASISCKKAQQQLGWNPLSLQQAIKRTVDFFSTRAESYPQEKGSMLKYFHKKVTKKID